MRLSSLANMETAINFTALQPGFEQVRVAMDVEATHFTLITEQAFESEVPQDFRDGCRQSKWYL